MQLDVRSPSDVSCILCKRSDETKTTGPLSSKRGTTAHQNCLIYASGICCKYSPTCDELFGFDVDDVINEYKRGTRLTCHYCKKKGATVGCEVQACRRSYHYPCARKDHATHAKDKPKGIYTIYCQKHTYAKRSGKSGCDADQPERNGLHSHYGEPSSESESTSSSMSQHKKRISYVISSDSDHSTKSEDAQKVDDIHGPLESDVEDNTPPEQQKHLRSEPGDEGKGKKPLTTTECEKRKRKREDSSCQSDEVDATDIDSCADSPSVLQSEHRHEKVPFTVFMDSVASLESENSPSYTILTTPDDDPHPCPPAVVDAVTLRSTATPPSLPVSRHLPFDSPPHVETGAADLTDTTTKSTDVSVNFQDPPPPAEPAGGPGAAAAPDCALFWKRCNELGCTETIFGELTEQLICLAERVQNQHATQQEYNIALKILAASGKLPEIFRRQEQDLEVRVQELQKKKQALTDARAMLEANHLS